MSRLYLIGYRGTGKSTVGPILAARLGWRFIDADAELERLVGKSVRDIFAAEGESGFRDREEAVLKALAGQVGCVIATGGGVVLRESNRTLLRSSGFIAWLTASPAAVWQRMLDDPSSPGRRPNLSQGGLAEVEELIARREPLYRATADLVVPTEGQSPEAVAAAILAAWETHWSTSSPRTPRTSG